MEWYLRVLKKYAVFSGRAGRREFWMFTLWTLVFILALAILDHALGVDTIDLTDAGMKGVHVGPLTVTYVVAMILPNLAVQCRRLHDIGKTGWLQLISVIPIVGPFILIYFTAQPGQTGPNTYGSDPNFGDAPSRD